MFDRMLTALTRCTLGAFTFTTLLASASQSSAMALPPGLEEGCAFTECLVRYWGEDVGGNGHYYGFVPLSADASWLTSSSSAMGSSLGDGSVGYLATVTSVEEQEFLSQGLLPAGSTRRTQVWIGGNQNDSTTPDQGWGWLMPSVITPEAWDYTNWSSGEPNDETTDEQYLAMWVNYYVNGVNRRGTWNDEAAVANSAAPIVGMLIEWEAPDGVPEPGTAALIALGTGLLALRRRARA